MPIVRTFTPIVAGVSGMHYRTFVIYNVIGGSCGAAGVTVLGYFLGQIAFVKSNIEFILVGIVAASVVPIVVEDLSGRARRHAGTARLRIVGAAIAGGGIAGAGTAGVGTGGGVHAVGSPLWKECRGRCRARRGTDPPDLLAIVSFGEGLTAGGHELRQVDGANRGKGHDATVGQPRDRPAFRDPGRARRSVTRGSCETRPVPARVPRGIGIGAARHAETP